MDVPSKVVYAAFDVLLVDNISVPTPIISGLMRPSSVGPQLEKLLTRISEARLGVCWMDSIAPTVNMFLAVPVVEMIS